MVYYAEKVWGIVQDMLGLTHWRDGVEICFFACLIYYFLVWLTRDTQKNLVGYFYLYCLLSFGSYYTQFFTVSYLMLLCSPLVILLFIVLHQETLQRNFVMLKRSAQVPSANNSWFDELTRACLHALNQDREIVCVIERTDSLKNTIQAPCLFYADVKKDILDIVLEKHVCTDQVFIWVNQEGKLVAINSTWHLPLEAEWISTEAQTVAKWKQDALFITAKTDALVFRIAPLTRTFDVVLQGKLFEDLVPHQGCALIKRYITATPSGAPFKQPQKQPKQTELS